MKKIIEVLILIGGLMMIISCSNPYFDAEDGTTTDTTTSNNGSENTNNNIPNTWISLSVSHEQYGYLISFSNILNVQMRGSGTEINFTYNNNDYIVERYKINDNSSVPLKDNLNYNFSTPTSKKIEIKYTGGATITHSYFDTLNKIFIIQTN